MKEVDFIEKRTLKQWWNDNQIGIFVTINVHLLFFLYLSVNQFSVPPPNAPAPRIELVFDPEMDPPKTAEELEAEQLAALEQQVNAMLNQHAQAKINLPNITVNTANSGEYQDASTGNTQNMTVLNTSNVRKPAEKKTAEPIKTATSDGIDDVSDNSKTQLQQGSNQQAQGPSVISYTLDGGTALYMPVPAYKCRSGGDVTVNIVVNKLGYVITTEIDKTISNRDDCLQEAAIRAAETARFSKSTTGQINRKGNIVYRFVPQ